MAQIKIVNLVAVANVSQRLDLLKVSGIPYTRAYSKRVVYLKLPEMHGMVTIYASGKLISLGTKHPIEAEEDLQKTVETLLKYDLIKSIRIKLDIRNIVAVLTLSHTADLEKLARKYSAIYEPEQFPAVIMKRSNPKVTLLIFNSGKIIISGAKNISDLTQISKFLKNIVK